ncbi:MAG: type II toxin-antitoxin system RelE/ParE family toxin [Candidatus Omnitrophica bacterium]|nr:type II toxin-antitoxin system RelE/ParE family toxin [Candidatus Omnitrophota bacterium]
MTEPRQIFLYQTVAGHIPFEEWLEALIDQTARAKIRVRLGRLSDGHWGDFKSVGHGVFELRIHWGPGYRVYFGLRGIDFVILLSGGDKRRQQDDIQKAQDYWQDYLGRVK